MKNKLLPLCSIISLIFLGACLGDSNEYSLGDQISDINTYLDEHNITPLIDASGIRFTIDSLGVGHTPRINSKITFTYTGKLLDGTVFDQGTWKNTAITSAIIGLQVAMPLLPNGTKATIYIPSSYGYGAQANGEIPANSNLIFNIKLKNITVTTAEKTQLAADTVKIKDFLAAQIPPVVAQKDTSGLRHVITQIGSGDFATSFDKLTLKFTGFLIAANGTEKGVQINTGTNEPNSQFDSRLVHYIRGFQVGLRHMQKGSKATFYIPSGLGFGTASGLVGEVNVPANSNLIYEVELLDIVEP